MKGTFRKLITVSAALLLALPVFLLSACSVEPRSEADVIPEELGQSEGLWLYCGNKRSRTDGTEEETLLTSVTIDEVEYGEEEFEVVTYHYVRSTYEIFYVLSIGEQYRAYHYNYLTQESCDLGALEAAERAYDYRISASPSLVYLCNSRTRNGTIYSPEAELLYEDFYDGTLDGDIIYRVSSYDFTYFKDGAYHKIALNASYHASEYFRCGNYVYFLGKEGCGVDLETEEVFPLSATDAENGMLNLQEFYITDGVLYVLSVNYVTNRNNETEQLTRLYKVSGKEARLLFDFGNAPYGIRMGIDGEFIYFTQKGARAIQTKYFVFRMNTEQMQRISKKAGGRGSTPEEIRRKEAANERAANLRAELSVGEYTFYVTSIPYDDQPSLFGTAYTKTCYYLMRDFGGKSEVLQYSLNGNGGHFYDDIREI